MQAPPRYRLSNLFKALSAFMVLIAIWQFGARPAGIPAYVLPVPSAIAARFWQTLAVQIHHLAFTATSTVIGLALALAVGVFLALVVIYVEGLRTLVLPTLAAFNSIPKVAVAPLFIIWFGFGIESKILLAFLLALFPVFVSSLTGLGEIDRDILDLSKLAGGSRWRIFSKVRLMNALPYITDALKVAFPLALVGSIVGEFIGGNNGIGYLIMSGQFSLDTPLVFSALVSITLLTTFGVGVVVAFENLFLKWRPSRQNR